MNEIWTWLLVLVAAVLVIGLLLYARGPEHHHGDDIGAWSRSISWLEPV